MIRFDDIPTLRIDGDEPKPIVKWEVWFMTPLGMTNDLQTAIFTMQEHNIILSAIRPIPVAVADDGTYEPVV